MNKFLQQNSEGYFVFNQKIVTDDTIGKKLLQQLVLNSNGSYTTAMNDIESFIECYDAPLIIQNIIHDTGYILKLTATYNYCFNFDCRHFSVDDWDRLCGINSETNIPFVFSNKAQEQFFSLLTEYDDDSFQWNNERISTPSLIREKPKPEPENFWSQYYETNNTPWDIAKVSPAISDTITQLKIQRSNILVLGCGLGHDAGWLAQQGHIVTAVDYSQSALTRAKELYPKVNFVKADAFNLPEDFKDSFDLVIEHTLYCAINPTKRNDLIKSWLKCLRDGGHLLGVFFVGHKPSGPPFATTEYELDKRLKNRFQFLYWTRWQSSMDLRQGTELMIYAQKKTR